MSGRPGDEDGCPDIVVVGSASRDVAADDARGWRLGGAAAYCGLTLARLGFRVGVILGLDGPAAEAAELRLLQQAGAVIRPVLLARGPVFENVETAGGRVQTCIEPGDPIPTSAMVAGWEPARGWLLAPVADELPDRWADVPTATALVGVGWQGLLRDLPRGGLVRRRAPRPDPILERAQIAAMSRHDVDPGTDLDGLMGLLRPDATLLVTEGSTGGWSFSPGPDPGPGGPEDSDGPEGGARVTIRYPAIPNDGAVDPTGAGDVFLAAFLAGRLGHPLGGSGEHGGTLRLAAAAASCAVEAAGLAGVPDAAAVARRIVRSIRGSSGPHSSAR